MKNKSRIAAFLIALALVLGVGSLWAQSNGATAKIPFNFQVRGQLMTAGVYSLHTTEIQGLIKIRNESTGHTTFIPALIPETKKEGEGKLVFRRYGELYFLSRIWLPYQSVGHVMTPSRQERELQAKAATKVELAFTAQSRR